MAESDILPFSIPSGEAHTILGMSKPIDEYLWLVSRFTVFLGQDVFHKYGSNVCKNCCAKIKFLKKVQELLNINLAQNFSELYMRRGE